MEISDRGVSHEVPKESNGFWVTVQINWGKTRYRVVLTVQVYNFLHMM